MTRLSLIGVVAATCAGVASAFTGPAALPVFRSTAAAASGHSSLARRSPAARFALRMAEGEEEAPKGNPWLSLNTRGGAMVWTGVFLVAPFILYPAVTAAVGDELQAGRLIGAFYTLFGLLAWLSSYVFRVGTKDMTYTKQLKQYEDAVIAKRFEELQADEVEALLNDMNEPKGGDKDKPAPKIRGSGWRPDQY